MRHFLRTGGFLLLLGCVVILSVMLVHVLFSVADVAAIHQQAINVKPTATLPSAVKAVSTAAPAPKPCRAKQRSFQLGVAFPEWGPNAYGGNEPGWLSGLPALRKQTAACWVEMPILFSQASLSSTVVVPGVSTPSISSVTYGIKYAHALGLHVFVTTLLQVNGPQSWAGQIQFTNLTDEQQWFDGYWQTVKPYAEAAAQAGAEQFAFGTEEEWLQQNAPNALWNNLIANAHRVFPGKITYDMNWTSLDLPIRSWMRNPDLTLGVSAYLPILDSPQQVAAQDIPELWATKVQTKLDKFAQELGTSIFISEIGYRNSADALYQPWVSQSSAPPDPALQASACDAALKIIATDPHILGSFFWGWDNVGAFHLHDSKAAGIIHKHYKALQA